MAQCGNSEPLVNPELPKGLFFWAVIISHVASFDSDVVLQSQRFLSYFAYGAKSQSLKKYYKIISEPLCGVQLLRNGLINQYGIPRPDCVGKLEDWWNNCHIIKKSKTNPPTKLHYYFYLLICEEKLFKVNCYLKSTSFCFFCHCNRVCSSHRASGVISNNIRNLS